MRNEQVSFSEPVNHESTVSRLAKLAVRAGERIIDTAIYVGGLAAMVVIGELEHRHIKKHGDEV